MRTIFDLIVKMSNYTEAFQKLALTEYEAREDFKRRNQSSMEQTFSETQLQDFEAAERRRYNTEVRPKVKATKTQIALLKNSFTDMVKKLLEMLRNHHNESLRFLSFRFNFNEYYN